MSTTLQNAPLGIMSTPILTYTYIMNQEDKTNFVYLSTIQSVNPTANANPDVKFLSESARLSAKIGRIRFNNCS